MWKLSKVPPNTDCLKLKFMITILSQPQIDGSTGSDRGLDKFNLTRALFS